MTVEANELGAFTDALISNSVVKSVAAVHKLEASEVVSEMSVVLSKRRYLVSDLTAHPNYMARVAINAARSIHRRSRRHTNRCVSIDEKLIADAAAPACAQDIELCETCRLCREAVKALPAKYRETIEAYYFAGISIAEYAASTGLKRSSVAVRLRRARTLLRECQSLVDHCS